MMCGLFGWEMTFYGPKVRNHKWASGGGVYRVYSRSNLNTFNGGKRAAEGVSEQDGQAGISSCAEEWHVGHMMMKSRSHDDEELVTWWWSCFWSSQRKRCGSMMKITGIFVYASCWVMFVRSSLMSDLQRPRRDVGAVTGRSHRLISRTWSTSNLLVTHEEYFCFMNIHIYQQKEQKVTFFNTDCYNISFLVGINHKDLSFILAR